MIIYYDKKLNSSEPRAHPWTMTLHDESHRYVDFKSQPQLIRVVLEDWVPFGHEQFAESFFRLLEWLNGKDSNLESNDCAFRPSSDNIDKQFKFAKRCDGRLIILFRDLIENTQTDSVDWLFNTTMQTLGTIDPEFVAGAVGFSFAKTVYMALGDKPKRGALGHQIMLSFFAYGKNRGAAHRNMNRLILNVRNALQRINARIGQGELNG